MKPEQLFDLTGKTAVVIGGTGELCGAMAEGMAAAGAQVVLVGRDAAKAEKRLSAITTAGGLAWFETCEVSSRDELTALADRIVSRTGKIDVLVNGAASTVRPLFWRSATRRWTASSASTSRA